MSCFQIIKTKFPLCFAILLKTLELQLFLMGLSLPILLGWGLPISIVAWFATPLFAPLFSLFLLCSTLLFFSYFLTLPTWPVVWIMEKICAIWLTILSWYKPWWLIGFCVPHSLVLCLPAILVVGIMHYKKYTHPWQRIWKMSISIICYCLLLKIYQYKHEPCIIEIPCNRNKLTVISTRTQTICIDNGALAQKPPNNAWIEYELLPAITKKTGKIGITDVICLQSSVRSLEIISLLHKHTPLQTIVIPAYHDEASHSSYHVALNRLKNELTNKDSLTVINKADSFNLKIHPQSSIIISSSKQEVASQGKTFLLLQVHGTVGNTHVEMKALKIKKMYSKSFKKD